MSSSVTVLQEGYSRWKVKGVSMNANGTATLVQSGGMNIIVDTLGPFDRDKLVKLLADKKIHPDNISIVVGTHNHTDHIGNLNLFTKCDHYVGDQKSRGDYFEFDIFKDHPYKNFNLTENVRLFSTPGHVENDVSVVVEKVDKLDTVGVVGDLFERGEDVNDESIWLDAGSADPDAQRKNRERIYSYCDYIVPGHGGMFKACKPI